VLRWPSVRPLSGGQETPAGVCTTDVTGVTGVANTTTGDATVGNVKKNVSSCDHMRRRIIPGIVQTNECALLEDPASEEVKNLSIRQRK
jgi:hypothetical protein